MRLITHNLLRCNIRGLSEDQGYPLKIENEKIEVIEAEYNSGLNFLFFGLLLSFSNFVILSLELTLGMLKKLNWSALRSALVDISSCPSLQAMETAPAPNEEGQFEEAFLRELHHALFEIHLQDGYLICPTSGRRFQVKDGIPNMLLHEDEV